MSKYIDTEKLIAEITRIDNEHPVHISERYEDGVDDGYHGCCDEIAVIIDSLQQEQPELSGYDKALLEVKSKVDELYEEASIGLNEYDSGLYNGIAETCMKLRGFIKARLDSDEQPKVDLDAEIQMYISSKRLADCAFLVPSIARHFYELGLKARKEE